jgi:hypothetical protein
MDHAHASSLPVNCEDKRRIKRVGEGIWAFAAASPPAAFSGRRDGARVGLRALAIFSSGPPASRAPSLLRRRGSSPTTTPRSGPTRCALFFSARPSQSKNTH